MKKGIRERLRFFLAAHPLQALVETWLLGLLILFPLSRIAGRLPGSSLTNGLFMMCALCGMWVVLRTRCRSTGSSVRCSRSWASGSH